MLMSRADGNRFSQPQEPRGPTIWLVLDMIPNKRGSLEAQLLALAARLHQHGARVRLAFGGPPPLWMRDALELAGARVHTVDFRRPVAATCQLQRAFDEARPDLVHFHFVRAYSPLVAVARLNGARLVVHDHMTLGRAVVPVAPRGPVTKELVHAYKLARAALLNRFVDARVAVSGFVAESVRRSEHVDAAHLVVIEHGIDLARFLSADGAGLRAEMRAGARPVVACVSRMAPEKGVDVLIRAIGRVGRDALLLLAGGGPDVERCKRLAGSLGLRDHVRFLGVRNDVERVYAAADVVVTPSVCDEAFGLSVVEAMASGRPVVVTDAGAMPDLVARGKAGHVVPRGDDVALAGAIGRLVDDRALARRLGVEARTRACESYGLDRWIERTESLYAALLPGLRPIAAHDPAPAPAPLRRRRRPLLARAA